MISHDLQLQPNHSFAMETTTQRDLEHVPYTTNNNTYSSSNNNNNNNNNSNSNNGNVMGNSLQYIQDKLKQSSHPTVIIFHLLFKSAALVFYLFGGPWVRGGNKSNGSEDGGRFITMAVIIILLLAADFWVVKNVTGRLLVGLRWWNKVQDEDTVWIFESAEDKAVNAFDKSVFWTVLYATPVVWGIIFIIGFLSFNFQWLLIVSMAIALSMANVYGYYKCSKEQAAQFQQIMQAGAQQGAMAMMRSNMLSALTGSNAAAAAATSAGLQRTMV